MTSYERVRLLASPMLPVLEGQVRRNLQALLGSSSGLPILLDAGARSSPYTIGLEAQVHLVDVPRVGEVAEALHLGIPPELPARLQRLRSNVAELRLEDMCNSSLENARFDGACAVEVIEHIDDDRRFVSEVARVLKPGGWFYCTTPNGEYIKNEPPHYNPDHRRHYTRAELIELLRTAFGEVECCYAVRTGKNRVWSQRSWSAKRPLRTLQAMWGALRNRLESRAVGQQSHRTAHLVAVARHPLRHAT